MSSTRLEDETELLTTEQVIDLLLEDAVLTRAAATCVLPAVRFGGSWRFRRSDLDAWILRQQAAPAMRES
jgi:excisionase family DNA binding protein